MPHHEDDDLRLSTTTEERAQFVDRAIRVDNEIRAMDTGANERLSPEADLRIRKSQIGIPDSDEQWRARADASRAIAAEGTKRDLSSGTEHRSEANRRQVAGSHYGLGEIQHWDIVAMWDLDYFQGQITKYVIRHKGKNGIQDLQKAQHFLEKYIEIEIEKARAKNLDPAVDHPTLYGTVRA